MVSTFAHITPDAWVYLVLSSRLAPPISLSPKVLLILSTSFLLVFFTPILPSHSIASSFSTFSKVGVLLQPPSLCPVWSLTLQPSWIIFLVGKSALLVKTLPRQPLHYPEVKIQQAELCLPCMTFRQGPVCLPRSVQATFSFISFFFFFFCYSNEFITSVII